MTLALCLIFLLLNQLTQVTIFTNLKLHRTILFHQKEKSTFGPIMQSAWLGVLFQKPENQLHGIDGLCCFSCKRSIPKKFIDRLSDKIDNRIKIEKNLTGVRLWIMDSKIKFVIINLMKTVNMEWRLSVSFNW